MATTIAMPGADEYAPYYGTYVRRVTAGDVIALLDEQIGVLDGLLRGLSEEQAAFRFAPGEWSIKEVVGHLGDAERAFGYRIFAFSRGEAAALPGFEQDDYAREGHFDARGLGDLLDEWAHLRRANHLVCRALSPEATTRRGVASDNPVSVRALVYLLAGHVDYHFADLREQYLPGLMRS